MTMYPWPLGLSPVRELAAWLKAPSVSIDWDRWTANEEEHWCERCVHVFDGERVTEQYKRGEYKRGRGRGRGGVGGRGVLLRGGMSMSLSTGTLSIQRFIPSKLPKADYAHWPSFQGPIGEINLAMCCSEEDLKVAHKVPEILATALPASQLRTLNLTCYANLPHVSCCHSLTPVLPSCASLARLQLEQDNINNQLLRALAHVLPDTRIDTLVLPHNRFNDVGALARALPKCHVTALDISHNLLKHRGVVELCVHVRSSRLRALRLASCGLASGATIGSLCESLSYLALEELDIGCNSFGRPGALLLAQWLPQMKQLHTLRVEKNNICSVGCLALVTSVTSKESTVRTLDMSHNGLGAAATKLLAKAVAAGKLRFLAVHKAALGHDGEVSLVAALKAPACTLVSLVGISMRRHHVKLLDLGAHQQIPKRPASWAAWNLSFGNRLLHMAYVRRTFSALGKRHILFSYGPFTDILLAYAEASAAEVAHESLCTRSLLDEVRPPTQPMCGRHLTIQHGASVCATEEQDKDTP